MIQNNAIITVKYQLAAAFALVAAASASLASTLKRKERSQPRRVASSNNGVSTASGGR